MLGHLAHLPLAGMGAAQDGLPLQLRQSEQRLPHHLVRHLLITVANGGGQRLGRDRPLTGMKQRMLHGAAQLPQIAGPGIGEQTIEGRRTELAHRFAPLRP